MIKKYNIYVLFFIVTSHLNFKLCTSIIDSQEIHQPKINEQRDLIQQQLIKHFQTNLFILYDFKNLIVYNFKNTPILKSSFIPLITFIKNYHQVFFNINYDCEIITVDLLRIVIKKMEQSMNSIENNEKDILSKTDWKQYIISQNNLMIEHIKETQNKKDFSRTLSNLLNDVEKQNKFFNQPKIDEQRDLISTTDINKENGGYFKIIIICIIVMVFLGLLYKIFHKEPVKDENKDSKKEENINSLPTTNLSNEEIQKLIQQHNQ